ncbi:snapalysin family zinc-dependent metalloprotease [Amycolatopsis sp. CA-230715]|uniref:snapalysin family zinc-dependent metalloprotease n=1 Tax=Amycolatopsis sp. CA-230715 TaxID=2745196 RepID=UPI001C024046|nr:snapalysin family zinc-dependent metalloprotease [Amycolatopsis sp. CA-230715]QWF82054.1 Extracellular small neutral protease [Amycolatopsis sp. CA-230715]
MSFRKAAMAMVAALGLAVLTPALVGAPASTAAEVKVRTIYYDASQSQEFKAAVDEGAQAWNKAVPEIQLKPGSGSQATVKILADDGWPRTYPGGFGRGTVYMGREAVNDGFYPPRIAAHELGHILGLPDNRNGRCDYLMSGHSSPTSCKSTTPHATEAAQVKRNAGGGFVADSIRAAELAGTFVY